MLHARDLNPWMRWAVRAIAESWTVGPEDGQRFWSMHSRYRRAQAGIDRLGPDAGEVYDFASRYGRLLRAKANNSAAKERSAQTGG